jgi:Tfp pilus assembly protein PilX
MSKSQHRSRGFTLIAALLIMVLLSAVAIGLTYLVTNEGQMARNEQEDNVAYYDAESGIEKLTADLASLYQTSLSPTPTQIQALTGYPPTTSMVGYTTYNESITYNTDANGNPVSSWNTVSAGVNQGLFAEIVPLTLTVNATRPTGASVNITRNVEVALIPVFQFGVFCGYDCSYFPGPNFSFGGRVHTNGNLFLADGGNLVFNDKISAYTQIVLDQLENNHPTSAGYTGAVYISTAANGCPLNSFPPPVNTNCVLLSSTNPSPAGDASWSGGFPGVAGGTNSSFPSISGTFNGYYVNSLTGATNLQLPFVQNSCTSNPPPCTDPIQIIRKPVAGESSGSSLGQSRLYNKAQIRILIADTEAALRPGIAGDAFDVQFTTGAPSAPAPNFISVPTASVAGNQYFAWADTTAVPPATSSWKVPLNPTTGTAFSWTKWPLLGELTTNTLTNQAGAGGQGAWIRVEYLNGTTGVWTGVTQEWLGYGFGRSYNTTLATPGSNAINPNAILILQQLRPGQTVPAGAASTASNWYPINFYDAREGQPRDVTTLGCTVNGVMNAVELDAGNLAKWLAGTGAYNTGSGTLVNFTSQNGYLLYFSDRRGMLPPTGGNATNGESGLEDVVNSGSATGVPDGTLEAKTDYTYSPEDVDLNNQLDNWGGANIGYGFGVNTNVAPYNPYQAPVATNGATCTTTALANAVSGARHVLKLVDGGMDTTGNSYLPMRTDTNPKSGGFTVASENPVYVQGNYNSSQSDPFWTNNANNTTLHAAAAIIADSVTVLSNNWSDLNSLTNPTAPGNRSAGADTYYRMAVSGGKNIPFPQPAWGGQDMGTDGGLHNFLRYLESWGGVNLWYNGSLVSMYYAEYNTGIFKCCTTVYSPPTRKYFFDTLFLNPKNLPPGTPEFQDIVNLSYRQNLQPQ